MSAKNTVPTPDEQLEQAAAEYGLVVSADGRTVSGSLEYGVSHQGNTHYDFAMHLLTVREDMAIDPALSGQARMLASYAATLDRLGTVPGEVRTADWLADNMVASDFDALYFAQELLLKKRRRAVSGGRDTVTPC